MKKVFLVICSVLITLSVIAQKNVRDSLLNIKAIGGHFGFHLPMADLGDRVG